MPPPTSVGVPNRWTASQARPPVTTTNRTPFTSAARIEELRQPYVRRAELGRRDRWLAPHASRSPRTSLRLCAASASRAVDPAMTPNTASVTTKRMLSATPRAKARSYAAGPCV